MLNIITLLKKQKNTVSDTEEERERLANKELEEIIKWGVREEDKLFERYKAEGRCLSGLDGDYPEVKALHAERNRRIEGLKRKYYPEWFEDETN